LQRSLHSFPTRRSSDLGEGNLITSGLKKIAVYRDYDNSLKAFSAVCPHLGCIVQWNADEKSFDCPCHGSRFACDGTVINGPSKTDRKSTRLNSSHVKTS